MPNRLNQFSEIGKNAIDVGVGSSLLFTWTSTVEGFLKIIVIVLAIIWGYYRIQDMRLSIKIKKMKIRRHKDV